MCYLNQARSFDVVWTDNLAEHLSINWKLRVVTIYAHKLFLRNHLRYTDVPIIPSAVLEEALDTLNLLFPYNDAQTEAFLKRHEKPFYSLGYCGRTRVLDLSHYRYWRARVADLVDVMQEEPARVFDSSGWQKDGRNLLAVLTFWIAIGVALLTVISIAFGVVQTLYSIKQYNLALAQACSVEDAQRLLPGFC